VRREVSDWRLWLARAVVIAAAVAAGLTIVCFTWLTERSIQAFFLGPGCVVVEPRC